MKTILFIIASVLCVFLSTGQCVPTNNLNISTGYDPVTNTIINAPAVDPLWRSVNLPPINTAAGWAAYPSASVGTARLVTPFMSSTNWNNNNSFDSSIMSINNIAAFGADNRLTTQPFRFVREFCVLEGEQEVTIDLRLKADDCARITLYDATGAAIFGTTTVSGSLAGSGLGAPWAISNVQNFNNVALNGWPYTANHTLSGGSYTLEIEMLNTDGSGMGVVLSGVITTVDGTKSLANDTGCCDVGTIYGQKVLDQDCDGTYTQVDLPGQGITVELLDASLTSIATAATDVNGDFFFRNVPFGSYRVVEVLNDPNYTPRTSAIRNVTLDIVNQSHYITFYNCPSVDDFIAPDDCCVTKLDIWNEYGTPSPLVPLQTTMATGERVSLATETFEIHRDALIPINELRVVVTDIQFDYDLEACAQCVENPGLWGSIYGNPQIGVTPDALTKTTQGFLGDFVDDFNERKNQREIIWKNKYGAMLKAGDTFDVIYALPPASEIPCCAISARICTEISWKDANCNLCAIQTCSDIDMLSAQDQLDAMTITVEKEGCCERKLTATVPNATYNWSTGETTQSIVVSDNGVYDVDVTLGGVTTATSVAVTDVLAGAFPRLSYIGRAAPDSGMNLVIRDYTKGLNANFAYNATKYTLWIFNRYDTGSKNGAFRKIEGYANCETGFKNGDIQWDGRDDNGNKVGQDAYVFVLRLENCTQKCSSENGTCNETHSYETYNECLTRKPHWFPPFYKCEGGFEIKNERIGTVTLVW